MGVCVIGYKMSLFSTTSRLKPGSKPLHAHWCFMSPSMTSVMALGMFQAPSLYIDCFICWSINPPWSACVLLSLMPCSRIAEDHRLLCPVHPVSNPGQHLQCLLHICSQAATGPALLPPDVGPSSCCFLDQAAFFPRVLLGLKGLSAPLGFAPHPWKCLLIGHVHSILLWPRSFVYSRKTCSTSHAIPVPTGLEVSRGGEESDINLEGCRTRNDAQRRRLFTRIWACCSSMVFLLLWDKIQTP